MIHMGSGRFTRLAIRVLDSVARLAPQQKKADHLGTGEHGEEEAYFYLREGGYVIVGRNFRSPRRRGRTDVVGWQGHALCFIEVKSSTSRSVLPPDAAVNEANAL